MEEIIVSTYAHPDLDGVSCMYAYSELLNKQGKRSNYYILEEPRPEVSIVCDIFDIKLNGRDKLLENDKIVIVDNHSLKNFPEHSPDNIIEIIDHHTTKEGEVFPPYIKVQIDIIGAAATIVAERFREAKIQISRESAILLYYGIISNSVNLKSDVTSERDIEAAKWLASQCEEISKEKIKEIFIKKSDIKDEDLRYSMEMGKIWNYNNKKIIIGQLEIANAEEFLTAKSDEIYKILRDEKIQKNADYIFLNCIDILRGYNIILSDDKETEKFLKDTFGFNSNNKFYKSDKIILRKELIRELIITQN